MATQFGPHRPGDVAYDTLRSAADRLLTEVGGALHRQELDLLIDDGVAAEVMRGERVDTVLVAHATFALDDDAERAAPPDVPGVRGLVAFTERRMIVAATSGIIKLRRNVEVFRLDGTTRFDMTDAMIDERPRTLIELENPQGRHRIHLPDSDVVPASIIAGWSAHIAGRLCATLAPSWDGVTVVGWEDEAPTIAMQRPPLPPPST